MQNFYKAREELSILKKKKKKLIKGLEKEMARDATGIAKKLQECPVLVTKLKI
jgi:hypothetical protein